MNSFFIKQEYTIEYSYGGVKMLAFVEAISKKQAEEIFKERYSNLCRIVRIKTIAEKSDEFTDTLIELTKKMFEKAKNENIKKSAN